LVLLTCIVATRRFSDASSAVFAEATGVLLVLGAMAWWGARRGPFGPAGRRPVARVARAGALLMIAAVLAWFLSPAAGGATDDPSGWWLAGGSVILYWAAALALTSEATEPRTMLVIVVVSSAATIGWSLSIATLQVARNPTWPVLIAASAALVACLLGRGAEPVQTALATLGTGGVSAIGIFGAGAIISALDPVQSPAVRLHPIPPPAGAQPETMDQLIGVLLIGAVLSAITVAAFATRTVTGTARSGTDPAGTGQAGSKPSSPGQAGW
jgi:hypothetical protein